MHSIGNDIVDLNLAKTQSNWQRKGFLEKQFTDFEQKEIRNSENPFLQVWLFWSMKEAAYKCYTQEHQKRFFAPKNFSCKTLSNQKGCVQIENNIYDVNILISNNYIHSVALEKNGNKMVSELFFINKNRSQSQTLNQKLVAHFAKNIQLIKNDFGVPYVYHQQKKLPISISTSHHGNYGAFAISYHS